MPGSGYYGGCTVTAGEHIQGNIATGKRDAQKLHGEPSAALDGSEKNDTRTRQKKETRQNPLLAETAGENAANLHKRPPEAAPEVLKCGDKSRS